METDQVLTQVLRVIFGFGTAVIIYFLKDLSTSIKKAVESINSLNVKIATLIEKDNNKSQRLDYQEKQINKIDSETDFLRRGHIENSTKINSLQETIFELKNQD